MGKFSDSSYYILKNYFNVLLTPKSGTDNSFITSARKSIWAEGGLNTFLYQKNESGDFIKHKFLITDIEGNDFIFRHIGSAATHNLATSLEMGQEMYFRKDSFFHDWLRNNSSIYEDDINTNKSFIYFGKIYPITGSSNYNIIFDGMKDYVMAALPEHNQTDNLKEFMEVYFDQVHHDIYNMTKTMWSFFDANEINIKHLNYLASRALIETDKDKLPSERILREFVDQLPYWLKRKGTYTAYFVIYKLLLGNTKNKLNVYERWVEWCLRELKRNAKAIPESDFEDHHVIEFYNVNPTGGAGPEYYNQFDYTKYPTYADVAPTGDCVQREFDCNKKLADFTDFIGSDDGSNITLRTPSTIQIDNFDPSLGNNLYLWNTPYTSAANYIRHCFTTSMDSTAAPSGGIFVWTMSKDADVVIDSMANNWIGVSYDYVGQTKSENINPSGWYNPYTDIRKWELLTSETSGGYVISVPSAYNSLGVGDAWASGGSFTIAAGDEVDVNYTLKIGKYNGAPSGEVWLGIIDDNGDTVGNFIEITPQTNSKWIRFKPKVSSNSANFRLYTEDKIVLKPFSINQIIRTDKTDWKRRFKLWEQYNSNLYTTETSAYYSADKDYYLTVEKIPSSSSYNLPSAAQLKLHVYRNSRRVDENKIEVTKLNLHESAKYNNLYPINYRSQSVSANWSGDVNYLYESSDSFNTVGPTGFKTLSPHYKLEIDLSSEPLGTDYIITEDIISEILRYWAYIKPVSKFAHYRELISPIGKIDDLGESISLYGKDSTAVCDTRFINPFPSASSTTSGYSPSADFYYATDVHVQPISTLTWIFNHDLNSKKLITQVYDKDDIAIYPARIWPETKDTIRFIWSPARRGRAFVAGLKPWNSRNYFVSGATWDINHNMGTSGASGVLSSIYNNDLSSDLIPDEIQVIDQDNLRITWGQPMSGYVFIRDDDYYHQQTTASTIWNIEHNLNSRGNIIQFYDHSGYRIYPAEITLVDYNTTKAEFNEAVSGTAPLITFEREVNESNISDNIKGDEDNIGYWKIGNGGSDAFDPAIRGDLSTILASGSLDSVTETDPSLSGSYLFKFHVPEGEAYTINEMGIFDIYKRMNFYTSLSTLHKPSNVQLDVIYRIRKTAQASS